MVSSDEVFGSSSRRARVLAGGVCLALAYFSMPVCGQEPPADITQTCRQMLEDAVQDKNPDVRKDAVEALSLAGADETVLRSLSPVEEDHDVLVRVALMGTLGDLKSKSALPILQRALDDPVPEVALAAARSLYRLHDPAGTRFLLAVVGGESKGSSSYLTQQERSAVRLLHTPTKLLSLAAINAVGFAPVPGLGLAISSAQGILSQPDASARAAALLLIGHDHNSALADTVKTALVDKEWSVRAAAVHVVATHPYPTFRGDLGGMLDDKKSAVRLRAAAAYLGLAHASHHVQPKPAQSAGPASH